MKIKEYNSHVDFMAYGDEFINSNNAETVLIVLDETEVIYGANGSCNEQWCKENNIPCFHKPLLQGGGCIVGVKGNVFLDVKRKQNGGECLSDVFSKALCEFLEGRGLSSVRTDNNDVLVDGYKVASGCESMINVWQYMGYQIAVNQDMNVIEHACNKQMVKVPKGLSEYGITTREVVAFCKDYFSKH